MNSTLMLSSRKSRYSDGRKVRTLIDGSSFSSMVGPSGSTFTHIAHPHQFLAHPLNAGRPVVLLLLADHAHGVVPDGLFAIPRPAPVAGGRNHHDDRLAQCSSEMRNRSVYRHHDIE